MSVALRSSSHLAWGSHTDPAVSAPGTVVDGDVLLMIASVYNPTALPPAPVPPAGWTMVPGMPGSGQTSDWHMSTWAWTKTASGEPSAYAVTQAAGSSAYWIGSYSGVDTATPVPASGGTHADGGTGSTSTVGSVTATVDGSMIVIGAADNGDSSTTIAPSGTNPTFTNELPGGVVLQVCDGTMAPAGATGARTWANNNTSAGWTAIMLALTAGTAAPPVADPPDAPTGVTATASNAAATVHWTAPAHDGGAAITGYVVSAYAAGVLAKQVSASASATSVRVSGLTNGTAYTFTVSASNSAGASPESAPSGAVTPTAPPPLVGSGLVGLIAEIAEALVPLQSEIADLNIYPGWWDVPTPPAIDIYPSNPFQIHAGFGAGNNQVYLTVRARASMADVASGQAILLRLLDPSDPASVERALEPLDVSIGEGGVSGFTVYADDAPMAERLIGCEWKLTALL